MSFDTKNVPDFVRFWANDLNCKDSSIVRLEGGINNYVYSCKSSDLKKWVIKGYKPACPGMPDRMSAEVEFLRFSSQVIAGFTPELIKVDTSRRCIVLEYIQGKPFLVGEIPNNEAIEAARTFFQEINRSRALASNPIRHHAIDGFLSITEHLSDIRNRLSSLSTSHISSGLRELSDRYLAQLYRNFNLVEEQVMSFIFNDFISDNLNPEILCVSPGDFGFHNAIQTDKGVKFIDFEFSGLDDPTKTILDFIFQPRIPINSFSNPLLSCLDLSTQSIVRERALVLKPILLLKWSVIILSFLSPTRATQFQAGVQNLAFDTLCRHRLSVYENFSSNHDIDNLLCELDNHYD